MILSVIIPCFNEKNTIKEIITVDDFSNDGMREILQNEIEPLVNKIIYH